MFIRPPTESTPAIRAKYRKPIFKEVSKLTVVEDMHDNIFEEMTRMSC
jgi:hypothetical protein